MINIAICDDNKIFREDLVRYLEHHYPSEVNFIKEFETGNAMIDYVETNTSVFDFVLLDYKMKGLNGIDTGLLLRKNPLYQHSVIFFITSYNANPSPIVEVHPFAYFKKPLDYDQFNQKFSEALLLYNDTQHYITISTKARILRLQTKEILYLHSGYRSTVIHMTGNNLTVNLSLRSLENILNANSHMFVRINNHTIINLSYLLDSGVDYVVINDAAKTRFKLTRTYHMNFLKKCAEILFH